MALYIARMRDMSGADGEDFVTGLKEAPDLVQQILDNADSIKQIA